VGSYKIVVGVPVAIGEHFQYVFKGARSAPGRSRQLAFKAAPRDASADSGMAQHPPGSWSMFMRGALCTLGASCRS
jgi:hypothetical protein